MAIGDQGNMLSRLKSTLPSGWFSFVAPVRDAVLGGIAASLAWNYSFFSTVKLQTRIATATGYFLDIASYDFLGLGLLRRSGEPDDSFRARIAPEIFRERVTRKGLAEAAEILTGNVPKIIELWNTGDCGAWDTGTFALADAGTPGASLSGWDCPLGGWDQPADFALVTPVAAIAPSGGAGCWGSTSNTYQIFMTVFRPNASSGVPVVAGLDTSAGGFDVGAIEWISSAETGVITDADIYASIAATAAAGVTVWVAIVNADGSIEIPVVDGSFDFSIPGNIFPVML